MPSTQRLLYRSERIATEPGLPGLVNVVGERTPHFAFRRGTFSRIESTMELDRVIETRGYSSCSLSAGQRKGSALQGRYNDILLTFYYVAVITFCVQTREALSSQIYLLTRERIPLSRKSSRLSKVDRVKINKEKKKIKEGEVVGPAAHRVRQRKDKVQQKVHREVAIKFTACGFPLSTNAMPITFAREASVLQLEPRRRWTDHQH